MSVSILFLARSSGWMAVPSRSGGGEHRADPASCCVARSSTVQPICCRNRHAEIGSTQSPVATSISHTFTKK
jgi:hypothetical protein